MITVLDTTKVLKFLFIYLKSKQAHGYKTHPAVKGVEIADWGIGQVVGIQDGNEAHHHARDGQGVEDGVEQLDIDAAATATHTVQ